MNADDPRHGENRGYNAGCREHCCRTAAARYRRSLRARLYLGRVDRLRTDGTGTRRRIRALMAIGWSTRALDRHVGRKPSYTYRVLSASGDVYLTTAMMYRAAYERLSMTRPPVATADQQRMVTRNIRAAAQRGYAVPLAWDEDAIDDPAEAPTGMGHRRRYLNDITIANEYDEAVVLRVLGGDFRVPATYAERCAVVARWPGSHNELERRTRWKIERYIDRESA